MSTDASPPLAATGTTPAVAGEGARASRGRRIGASVLRGLNRAWPPVLIVVLLFAVWEGYVRWKNVDPSVLPTPPDSIRATIEDWDVIRTDIWVTFQETIVGLAIAIAVALIVGLFIDRFEWVRRSVYPVCVASQTIPIVAIAPLMVIWFDIGLKPKFLLVAFYTFFPIVVGLVQGLAGTDREAMNLLRTMRASRRQILFRVRFPSALPQLFTGIKITVTYAVVAAVLAEYVGAFDGLGVYMMENRNAFRTDLVVGAALMTTLMTLALFAVVVLVEKLIMPWYKPVHQGGRWW